MYYRKCSGYCQPCHDSVSYFSIFLPCQLLRSLESGDFGAFYYMMAINALQSFIFDELDEEDLDMKFVASGILTDYYYRTCDVD